MLKALFFLAARQPRAAFLASASSVAETCAVGAKPATASCSTTTRSIMTSAAPVVSRAVNQQLLSQEQGEGMGARVRRSIGRPELRNFDPFLMLDEFRVKKGAGFPDHPHRGFETVTYMLDGAFEHEDFCGHRGRINAGDLQWMTAGRGVVHAEMPASEEGHGLQLWVNLGAKDKLVEPQYQELKADEIPHAEKDGVEAIIIAGKAFGVESPVFTRTPTYYLHFKMQPDSRLDQEIPAEMNAFLYTLSGTILVGESGEKCEAHSTVTLTRDDEQTGVTIKADKGAAEFVLIAGVPHGEPIVQYGPFVMNTPEQIQQAFLDYQTGRNGFEKARRFQSEIGKPLM
ncbi:pirin family protein [Salpingoeca rosetta]|uniref:Pirin family protein n=1 Tax=Salpingoeca rosetta (strain ATCC 50818 / BSB-021) TaxID=946362 RepID=F2TX92_SALR5|nr:pirin family protein [Salpingoeca rosetta]EGD76001.1 pirin family protein [Salpingoeca rosetta]|eukprot:XP_004998176.1 pirin family protein [Salpingoeca rosetta]